MPSSVYKKMYHKFEYKTRESEEYGKEKNGETYEQPEAK